MDFSPPICTSQPTTVKEKQNVFYLDYPIAALKPAPYNPRTIDAQAFLALQHSITTLGTVKPIIAGEDGTIVVGHQRSRGGGDCRTPAATGRRPSVAAAPGDEPGRRLGQ